MRNPFRSTARPVAAIGAPGEVAALMPGPSASMRVFDHHGVAYVFDTTTQTMTWLAQVEAPEYLLQSAAAKNERIAKWSLALAAACPPSGAVAQMQVLERTTPDPTDTLDAYAAPAVAGDGPQVQVYRELTAAAGRGAAKHESFVAVTVRKAAAARAIKTAADVTAMLEFTDQVVRPVERAMAAAGIVTVDRPSVRRLGEVVLSAFNPAGVVDLPVDVGVPAGLWGPGSGQESADTVTTDGNVHAALVVYQWPQGQATNAEFLWPVVFPESDSGAFYARTLSLFLRPYRIEESRRNIQATHSGFAANQRMRDKLGRVTTLEDTRELTDLTRREQELDEGHREVGLAGLVTVTSRTAEELEQAVVMMTSAATSANLDLRRVRYQVGQAFMAGALPLGKVIV